MKGRNKRRERTEALKQYYKNRAIAEQTENDIEQHRFNKLIKKGIIVNA